jgi:opacity protein-like surface antigen
MKLSNIRSRFVAVPAVAAVLGVCAAAAASAADVVTPVITSATTDLQTTLLATGGVAIGIGGVVLALRKGWKFFKGMI